jgi:hypothetical protein
VLYVLTAFLRELTVFKTSLFSLRVDLELSVNRINRIQLSVKAREEAEPNYTNPDVKLQTFILDYLPHQS